MSHLYNVAPLLSRSRRAPSRRGALLLVCLSLLVLFAVIAVTFVLLAGNYRRGSALEGRVERYGDDFRKQLHDAFGQVVRDVPAASVPASALSSHSLLNDFYGDEVVTATIALITPVTLLPGGQGQLLDLSIENGSGLSIFDGYYNGCTLTMLDGPAGMQTTRIVGFNAGSNTTAIVRVMAFGNGGVPGIQNRLMINGRPFNGAGFGYNITTGKLDSVDAPLASGGLPLALLPHHRFLTTGNVWRGADEDYDAPDTQNMLLAFLPAKPTSSTQIMPSLHRPDLINFLAQTASASASGSYWNDGGTNLVGGTPLVPLTTDGAFRQRQAMLRPHPADHAFQGSAPFKFADRGGSGGADLDGDGANTPGNFDFTGKPFDPINGPWDVDNDADGVMDSVWVDLGYPVQTAADGRQYKPLFAILCVDLDSRLNVNAHGSYAQIDPGSDGVWGSGGDDPHTQTIADSSGQVVFAGGAASVNLPRGMGFGPAEINLMGIFSRDEVEKLLRGDAGTGFPGRYGEAAGGVVEAGVTGTADAQTRIRFSEFTNDYLAATPRTAFGSPPDVWGRGAVGLDLRGQPLYWKASWANEVLSNPYSMDLSQKSIRPAGTTGTDSPFTVAELERVLRMYDVDSTSLPNRLVELPNTADPGYPGTRPNTAYGARNLLTTDSVDVPVASPALTREMIDNLSSGSPNAAVQMMAAQSGISVADFLRAMLISGRGYPLADLDPSSGSYDSAKANTLSADLAHMLDPDLLSGLRMNLNKPFGNGRDDNSNGVVDEPEEAAVETILPDPPAIAGYDGTLPFDHDNDGATGGSDADDQMSRYRFAKQLFILAMMVRDLTYKYPTDPSLNATQQEELTVRRIAQWAINVVDARDADAIMTPFEYDINPFDGWSVDGIVGDNPGPNGTFGDGDDAHPGPDTVFGTGDDGAADFDRTNAQRRIVWGCEAPDLLLTETLAFHDRRAADSKHDNDNQKRRDEDGDPNTVDDDDLDQPLIPQGSLFFELYCTRSPNNPVFPAELYSEVNPGVWALDLGRMSPADASGNAYPVWRIAISDPQYQHADNDVETLLSSKPDTISFEPPQTCLAADNSSMSLLAGAAASGLKLERIVWLAAVAPNTHVDATNTYWARGGPFLLGPGGYAVVGPRTETYIGATTTLGTPSAQVIRLNNASMHVKNDGTSTYPAVGTDIQPQIGIVVAGDIPLNTATPWADGANTADHGAGGAPGIGISISEPLYSDANYYREPTEPNPNNANKVEAYGDIAETDATKHFIDEPLDGRPGTMLEARCATGVQGGLKRTLFLQRLANPLRPWNPDVGHPNHVANLPVNLYLTVDWMPVECIMFNGLDREPSANTANPWDPLDTNSDPNQLPFATRERGTPRKPAGAGAFNVWSPSSEAIGGINIGKTGPTTNIIQFDLEHTVGYLNQSFHDTTATTPWLTSTTTPAVLPKYYGDPIKPFPWITWNNRPFASPLETLQVPSSHPARLGLEFSFAAPAATSPYGANGDDSTDIAPFRHLLNFFHDLPTANESPHLVRVLDYLRVPSPFNGTETILNPSSFTGNASGTEGLHPPFNRVSNFRDPGRINLNTISDQRIWTAILNNHQGPTWSKLVDVMRADGSTGNANRFDTGNLPGNSPTVFGNPFRGAGGGLHLMPGTPATGSVATPAWPASLKEVDATLLRSGGSNNNNNDPLFVPKYVADPGDLYRHTDRNSHFRYEELQRMSSLVTTRSNVYAIWITVGYFEVQPVAAPYNRVVYPDGYQLKQELGAETGEITRHRAFYIYDRSIPVGYQRGKDLNIDRGILLKRVIE